MDDLIKQLVGACPNLAALIIVVCLFLRFIAKRDEIIKSLTEEHIEERKHQRDVIERNSIAAAMNTAALNNVAHLLTKQTEEKS